MEDRKGVHKASWRAAVLGACVGVVLSCLALGLVGYGWVYGVEFEKAWLDASGKGSVRIVDRQGVELRHMLNADGERRVRVGLDDMSPWVVEATRVSEDARFFEHAGVDPWSVLRAAMLNVEHGRIYSGASTISMQLVRMALPGFSERTFQHKVLQAVWALRLEESLTKDEILEEYLNRAPYGNHAFGVEMASRLYFGRNASELSVAQGAFLAVLPRSPAGYNPYHFRERLDQRHHHILGLMYKYGSIDQDTYQDALREEIRILPRTSPFEAPHFVETLRIRENDWKDRGVVRVDTTLDARLQSAVEDHVERALRDVEPLQITQSAVVVLDNASGDVLALVGSRDWNDLEGKGRFNAALAMRPVSSMLSPFIVAESLEQGGRISDVYPDVQRSFEIAPEQHVWPRNDEGGWRGPVRLGKALSVGLRMPIWNALDGLNGESMGSVWSGMDLTGVSENWRGKGVRVLGGGSHASLLGLTAAYSALVRGGEWVEPVWTRSVVSDRSGEQPTLSGRSERVFSNSVSALVTGALADDGVRLEELGSRGVLGVPFPVAWSWGVERTSGDVWAIGSTSEVTVGVWMGRFDGRPLDHVSGLDDASPLLRSVLLSAMQGRDSKLLGLDSALVTAPVCAVTGHRPGEDCDHVVEESFVAGSEPTHTCDWHVDVPLDRRTGMRARPSCASDALVWEKYVALPAEYRRWARAEGVRPLSRAFSPACPLESARVEIDVPGMREEFLIPASLLSPQHDQHAHIQTSTQPFVLGGYNAATQ